MCVCWVAGEQLMALRDIMQGDENNPKVPMENNCRPTQPLHHRPVRTNINFQSPVTTHFLMLVKVNAACSEGVCPGA